MRIKILKNVVIAQKFHKKDEVVDLDPKTAGVLLDREYAEEAPKNAHGGAAATPAGAGKKAQEP